MSSIPWPILYIGIAVITILISRITKKLDILSISYVLSLVTTAAFTVVLIKLLGIAQVAVIKLLAFLFVKFKALIAKKLILILAGFFGGSIVPVLNVIIWIAVGILFLYSIKGFYSYITKQLQILICEIRDFFDGIYEKLNSILSIIFVMIFEAVIVTGPTVAAVYIAISKLEKQNERDYFQLLFLVILCILISSIFYIQYRRDTHVMRRLTGQGFDYSLPSTTDDDDTF